MTATGRTIEIPSAMDPALSTGDRGDVVTVPDAALIAIDNGVPIPASRHTEGRER